MKCSTSYTLVVVSDGASVKGITAYYALSSSSETTPSTSEFTTEVKTPTAEKKYLWSFEETTYSDDSTPTRTEPIVIGTYVTDGKDAPKVLVEYQYSASDRTPPTKLTVYKVNGYLVSFADGVLGDDNSTDWSTDPSTLSAEDSDTWETDPSALVKDTSKPYLWMRVSTDGGQTWQYSVVTGPKASFFEILSSKDTFRQNARGAVDIADEISFWVVRHNIEDSEKCTWGISPDTLTIDSDSVNADRITITIPVGFSSVGFTVTLSVGSLSETLSKTVYGMAVGTISPVKLTTITDKTLQVSDYPKYLSDGVSPVKDGDYMLVTKESDGKDYLIPYRYSEKVDTSTGTIEGWVVSSAEYENHSQIMGNCLQEVLANSQTVPSTSAMYGFFQSLVANDAFVKLLCAQYLEIQGAIYGGGYDKDGNNADNAQGFYLESETGTLNANNATFNNITATNSIVKGYFESKDDIGNILKTEKSITAINYDYTTSGYLVASCYGELQGSNFKYVTIGSKRYLKKSYLSYFGDGQERLPISSTNYGHYIVYHGTVKKTTKYQIISKSFTLPVTLSDIGCYLSIYAWTENYFLASKIVISLNGNTIYSDKPPKSKYTYKIPINAGNKGDIIEISIGASSFNDNTIVDLYVFTDVIAPSYTNTNSGIETNTYYDYRFYSEPFNSSLSDISSLTTEKYEVLELAGSNTKTHKYTGLDITSFYKSDGTQVDAYTAGAMFESYENLYNNFANKERLEVKNGSYISLSSYNKGLRLAYIQAESNQIYGVYEKTDGSLFLITYSKGNYFTVSEENELAHHIQTSTSERGIISSDIIPDIADTYDIGKQNNCYARMFSNKYFLGTREAILPVYTTEQFIVFSNRFCIYNGAITITAWGTAVTDTLEVLFDSARVTSATAEMSDDGYSEKGDGFFLPSICIIGSVKKSGNLSVVKLYNEPSASKDTPDRIIYQVMGTLSEDSYNGLIKS